MPCRYIIAGPSGAFRVYYDSLTDRYLFISSSGSNFWSTSGQMQSYLEISRKHGAHVTELDYVFNYKDGVVPLLCYYVVSGPLGFFRVFYDTEAEEFLLIFSSGPDVRATSDELKSYLDFARKRGAHVTELDVNDGNNNPAF